MAAPFGFERINDTLCAVVGPASALALMPLVGHRYPTLFTLTLVPGLLTVAAIAFLVKERERTPGVTHFLRQTLASPARELSAFPRRSRALRRRRFRTHPAHPARHAEGHTHVQREGRSGHRRRPLLGAQRLLRRIFPRRRLARRPFPEAARARLRLRPRRI